jgi:hypothetical protein
LGWLDFALRQLRLDATGRRQTILIVTWWLAKIVVVTAPFVKLKSHQLTDFGNMRLNK